MSFVTLIWVLDEFCNFAVRFFVDVWPVLRLNNLKLHKT